MFITCGKIFDNPGRVFPGRAGV